MYTDCRRRKIMAKHIALGALRPLHTCVKTLWHFSVILPVGYEFYKLIRREENYTISNFKANICNSFADIVRTPFYGTAITIVHLAGIIFGCINPNSLYYSREIVGKLERKLLRIEHIRQSSEFALAHCMSPMKHITLDLHYQSLPLEPSENITYDVFEYGLTWFAFATVKHLRKNRPIFYYCLKLPHDRAYISSAKADSV